MMLLHYAQNSRAVRVAWLLEELSIEYDIKKYAIGDKELRENEYKKINPLGRVPVLEDSDIVISESGAIIQYILSKYGKNKFIPDIGSSDFPYYLQWFHYAEGMIMPQMNTIVVETILLPPEKRNEVNLARAMKLLSRMLDVIEKNMENKKYLTNEFTAADMMTGHAVIMSRELGVDFSEKQNLLLYADRLLSRPALQKAWNL